MLRAGKACVCEDCEQPVYARKMCQPCYDRWYNAQGRVIEPVKAGWGERSEHPLYTTWCYRQQWCKKDTCSQWHDFWTFVRDVGDKPHPRAKLVRRTKGAPLGPGNFWWREPLPSNAARLARYRSARPIESHKSSRASGLKRRFGITAEDFDRMLLEQEGRCEICRSHHSFETPRKKTGKPAAFHVDHDHNTGQIRALLCARCNHMIGAARDVPGILRKGAVYLEKFVNAAGRALA